MKNIFWLVLIVPVAVLAQEASPTPVPQVIGFLDNLLSAIPATIPTWLLGVLVFVAELVVRFVPTAKPRSILLVGSGILKGVANILNKVSGLLDQLFQNVKS